MRKHTTVTAAAPGVGKSTFTVEEAVSLASGVDFLGFGIDRPKKVAVINNEETRDELERRIEATCTRFAAPFPSIAETLYLHSGVDAEKFVVARVARAPMARTAGRRRRQRPVAASTNAVMSKNSFRFVACIRARPLEILYWSLPAAVEPSRGLFRSSATFPIISLNRNVRYLRTRRLATALRASALEGRPQKCEYSSPAD